MKIIQTIECLIALSIMLVVTSCQEQKSKTALSMQGNNMKQAKLEKYRAKRDFRISPEPKGIVKKRRGREPIFVIQKHDASHLHYDFRLEINGVLKSWAIPKGPSTDPRVKRLAIETEDHPLDYAYFEGTIPEGEYGAGTVMIWDIGIYEDIKETNGTIIPMEQCYQEGHIEVFLHGTKLEGGYALTRFRGKEENPQWLLIKMKDNYADARKNPVSSQPDSAVTGRSLKEIAKEG